MLVLHRDTGKIEHRMFSEIIEYFNKEDTIVLNETKVIPARLIGKRADTGGAVEVVLLNKTGDSEWSVIISPGRARKPGIKIQFAPDFEGEVTSVSKRTERHVSSIGTPPLWRPDKSGLSPQQRGKDSFPHPFGVQSKGQDTNSVDDNEMIFEFNYPEAEFNLKLNKYGRIPLPPYIKREPVADDKTTYQTVYAKSPGACAAPTAGLHFTEEILKNLEQKGVTVTKITLHTGLGSFNPIRCENIEEHKMFAEYYDISKETADKISNAKKITAVGTTTVRTLETTGGKQASGWTEKFIYPGYEFKIVNKMITNFHLPKSTLLLLVCAFAGRELVLKAYREAIEKKYRFYSYGDAMLVL